MKKMLIALILFSSLCMCGCETTKNSVVGTALIGQGVADDICNSYKAADEVDNKFEKENW